MQHVQEDMNASDPRTRAFVSYSHRDAALVARVVGDLERNAVTVWQDIKAIVPGASISRSIEGALTNCDALILVLSRNSTASSWVEREYRAALTLQHADPSGTPRIIPCLFEGCDIPVFLRDILYADFRDYAQGFLQLATALGVQEPRIPSVNFRQEVKALLSDLEAATESLGKVRYPSPSHELFDVWSPLEETLRRLLAVEMDLSLRQQLDRRGWEIAGFTDDQGRPTLDAEPYPRNLFIMALASVIQGSVQLAARAGYKSKISTDRERLFWSLGGTPASN
jgi:hypothetical protein